MKTSIKKIDNVSFISIDNLKGMSIVLSSFGASIYQLELTNKYKVKESIILTTTSLNEFYYNDGYHGKSVGRFSGRIDKGKCKINDIEYNLDINWNNVNSLHGGNSSISFVNFDYEIKKEENYVDVIFTYLEKEDKLPGDVSYKITYRIFKNKNEFTIFFNALTNKDTIVNLTNHTYFNLIGNGTDSILNHKLKLNCDKYTNLNNELITTSIDKVNKVMDFQRSHKIGKFVEDESLQKHTAFGYDHCFIKKDLAKDEIAILSCSKSKRKLTIKTSYPNIVIYTCNYPKDFKFNPLIIDNIKYHAICLECQFIPNGINMDNVNKAILKKDEKYEQYINYKFD